MGEGEGDWKKQRSSIFIKIFLVTYSLAFSVQPLCSVPLWLAAPALVHHRDTENTEVAQRSYSLFLSRTSTSPKPTTSPSSINLDSP